MLATLFLHGKPGHLFGREFKLDVETPAELLHALMRLKPNFRRFLRDSEKNGVTYRVIVDGVVVGFHERLKASFNSDLHLYPIVIGSKRAGVLNTIIGAVLIVVGIFTYNYGGQYLINAGVAMMIGGIVQMIATPLTKTSTTKEEEKRGYLFSGAAMSAKQGAAVPVGYGKLHVGCILVSCGMFAERYVPPSDYDSYSGGTENSSVPAGSASGGSLFDMPPYSYFFVDHDTPVTTTPSSS